MIFTRLFFRHWSSYTHFKRTHLFVVPAEGGTAKDITPGDHDVPTFNLGGQDLYAISPDGQEVAYTSNLDEVEATSTNNDIFVIPITGGAPKKLSTSPGSDSTPLYSPDGRYLSWRMQNRAGYESDRFQLVVYDRKSGQLRNLTQAFDRWVGTMAWTPNSKAIYFTAEDKGEVPIYRVNVEQSVAVQEVVRGADDDLMFSPDGETLVFTRMSAQAPNEVYKFSPNGPNRAKRGTEQLSHLNDAVFAQVATQPAEPFWFTGAAGTKVEGFLVKPPDFDPQKKYPVKLLIHGGPQNAWGDEWSFRWNAQLMAADGYVVVQINPQGSTGYGQAFIDGINPLKFQGKDQRTLPRSGAVELQSLLCCPR
jgi:dipeptidyl aminopeptidase/acylaminoacyl peptidase